jgi:PAS domain S-box-containing protein
MGQPDTGDHSRSAPQQQSDSDFRAFADAAPAVLWVTNPAGACTFLSRGWYELTGQTEGRALGYGWTDAVHPDDRGRATQIFLRSNERRVPFELDCRLRDAQGYYRWAIDAGRPRFAADGRFLGFVGSVIDISDRRELEEQLRQAQKMEAVGRLAGGVAHDFNNLLTVIRGYVELLGEDLARTGHGVAELNEIAWAADRAAELTQQLLAISRKQARSVAVVDPNAIIRESETLLRRVVEANIRIEVDLDVAAGAVRVDRGQLVQVLLNLAVNARDAMPHGGTLTLRTASIERGAERALAGALEPGCYVMLSVSDTGAGMTEDVRAHVFEPFFTTKKVGKGTGLGLSTVYGIVKQSGGEVEIETAVGQGTTFRTYLPRVEHADAATVEPAAIPHSANGSETILLVEDDRAVRQLTARFLHQAGYSVIEATSGEDALTVASAHGGRLDLLVTDVVMPGISGRELADKLCDARPGLPVVYLSGDVGDPVLQHGLADQATLLEKPFAMAALLERVREALG